MFNNQFNLLVYKDDTILYANLEDFSFAFFDMIKINKLSLNVDETKRIIFRKRKIIVSLDININDINISVTYHFNFLGITFSNELI